MADIADFKARMRFGGARANQFSCILTVPPGVPGGGAVEQVQFLAKGASLPASNVSDVPVSYRGRIVHFAGEREFEPWTVEVYNDNDFSVRNMLEAWVDSVQNAETTHGSLNPGSYQTQMQVNQLDRNDVIVKTYNFQDAYPVSVGAIALDWDTNNAIEVYSVTFQYNYWTSPTSEGVNLG